METTIKLPNEAISDLRDIVVNFGFSTNSEFMETVVKDKILELKKLMFLQVAEKVSHGLKKQGVPQDEILRGFEESRKE